MDKRRPHQTKIEVELEEETQKLNDHIQRAHKKAHSEWKSAKKDAEDRVLKTQNRVKRDIAAEEQRIEQMKREAADSLSEKRTMIEEHLKQRRHKLEKELEKQERDEIKKALEEDGKLEVQRKKAEDEVDEEKRVADEWLKSEKKLLRGRMREAEHNARAQWEHQMEAAVKKELEHKRRKREQRMLAQQREAEEVMRQKDWERRQKRKIGEEQQRAREQMRHRDRNSEQTSARIVKAWMRYKADWKRIKERGELSFSDIPWPTVQKPDHALDFTPGALRQLLLSPHHSVGVPSRDRLHSELRRWRSTAFTASILPMVIALDKSKVKLGAEFVAQTLNKLLEGERASDNAGRSSRAAQRPLTSTSFVSYL